MLLNFKYSLANYFPTELPILGQKRGVVNSKETFGNVETAGRLAKLVPKGNSISSMFRWNGRHMEGYRWRAKKEGEGDGEY